MKAFCCSFDVSTLLKISENLAGVGVDKREFLTEAGEAIRFALSIEPCCIFFLVFRPDGLSTLSELRPSFLEYLANTFSCKADLISDCLEREPQGSEAGDRLSCVDAQDTLQFMWL
jgi:hypothetical protein